MGNQCECLSKEGSYKTTGGAPNPRSKKAKKSSIRGMDETMISGGQAINLSQFGSYLPSNDASQVMEFN